MLALISGSSLPDLHLIKLFSILFDVLLAWSVMQLVGLFRRNAAWKLAAFFLVLFWPTVVLNGALWGQCDSVYAALAVLSVYRRAQRGKTAVRAEEIDPHAQKIPVVVRDVVQARAAQHECRRQQQRSAQYVRRFRAGREL